MSAPQIVSLPATTMVEFTKTPFLAQQRTQYESVAGGLVYAVNLPAKQARNSNYQKWEGDGSTTSWASADIVNLANMNTATLTSANALEVVAKVNGVVLDRVNTGSGAGEFHVSSAGGGTIVFGSAPAAGAEIEVFITAASAVASFTLVANTPQEQAAYQVIRSVPAATAIRLM